MAAKVQHPRLLLHDRTGTRPTLSGSTVPLHHGEPPAGDGAQADVAMGFALGPTSRTAVSRPIRSFLLDTIVRTVGLTDGLGIERSICTSSAMQQERRPAGEHCGMGRCSPGPSETPWTKRRAGGRQPRQIRPDRRRQGACATRVPPNRPNRRDHVRESRWYSGRWYVTDILRSAIITVKEDGSDVRTYAQLKQHVSGTRMAPRRLVYAAAMEERTLIHIGERGEVSEYAEVGHLGSGWPTTWWWPGTAPHQFGLRLRSGPARPLSWKRKTPLDCASRGLKSIA